MHYHDVDAYHDALLRGLCADGAAEVARTTIAQESTTVNASSDRSVADELLVQIDATHLGDPWYGASRTEILDDITALEAASHPIAEAHSIWELVLHMTAWTAEVRRRLGGAEPGEPAEGDWPAVPKPTDAAWRRALDNLEAAHAALLVEARAMPAEQWHRPVGANRDAPTGAGVTIGAMLVGLAQHDAYHTGQVAILRKALR